MKHRFIPVKRAAKSSDYSLRLAGNFKRQYEPGAIPRHVLRLICCFTWNVCCRDATNATAFTVFPCFIKARASISALWTVSRETLFIRAGNHCLRSICGNHVQTALPLYSGRSAHAPPSRVNMRHVTILLCAAHPTMKSKAGKRRNTNYCGIQNRYGRFKAVSSHAFTIDPHRILR